MVTALLTTVTDSSGRARPVATGKNARRQAQPDDAKPRASQVPQTRQGKVGEPQPADAAQTPTSTVWVHPVGTMVIPQDRRQVPPKSPRGAARTSSRQNRRQSPAKSHRRGKAGERHPADAAQTLSSTVWVLPVGTVVIPQDRRQVPPAMKPLGICAAGRNRG